MYATSLTDSISLPVGGASNMGDIPGGAFFLISNNDMKSSGTLDVLGAAFKPDLLGDNDGNPLLNWQ